MTLQRLKKLLEKSIKHSKFFQTEKRDVSTIPIFFLLSSYVIIKNKHRTTFTNLHQLALKIRVQVISNIQIHFGTEHTIMLRITLERCWILRKADFILRSNPVCVWLLVVVDPAPT